MDVVYLGLILVIFVLIAAMARGCDRLGSDR